MIVDRGVPDLMPIPSSARVAAYKIDTGNDLPDLNDRHLFGLGKIDANGLVTPVASVSCLLPFHFAICCVLIMTITIFTGTGH